MAFPTRTYGDFGDEKKVFTVSRGKLGSLMELPDGSLYRFCETGEALGAGQLCQTPLAIANHDMDLAVAASAVVGATTFTVTLGATAVTKDQYKDGWAVINDGPGEGHRYRIGAHAAVASAGVMTVPIDEDGGLREALTVTTSLVGLHANPYNGSLLYNTTPDGVPTGVACTELASGERGWLQTRGWGAALVIGTAVLGQKAIASITTTGGISPHVITGDDGPNVALFGAPIAVTTDYGWVYINIE